MNGRQENEPLARLIVSLEPTGRSPASWEWRRRQWASGGADSWSGM